jgi:hypothetical protein
MRVGVVKFGFPFVNPEFYPIDIYIRIMNKLVNT